MEEGRYSFYAVRVGRTPRIYSSWEECNMQVHGFPFCEFKGFQRLAEAEEYINRGSLSERVRRGERRADGDIHETESLGQTLQRLSVGGGCVGKTKAKSACGVEKGSASKAGSPPKANHVVVVQDMVSLVRDVCKSIQVAVGGVFADDAKALQDAAFRLIEKIVSAEGLVIADYNCRVVQRLQGELEAMGTTLTSPLADRVRQLEQENMLLKAELDAFHEACVVNRP
ncbi:hypothetical protein PIB30_001695 [Stylosanthes scabra]|uniref:Ribonuclease H1 N-terminal domain-containing protein n=1 Tax=Stylosanthes scabra TaxID=79078 RepID=A0ABU6U4N2_9FABA|nr:hypothetical protein [Stylosanthes scabra]